MTLPEKITLLMQQNNYTQADIARRSGMTQSAISQFMKRKRVPNAFSLVRLAYALNVRVGSLLDGVDFP